MAPGCIYVGMDREAARSAQHVRDLVRIDVRDQCRLHGRRDCRRRLEAELHLSSARDRRHGRCRRRCSQVLIRRRQPRYEAAELELAKELEYGRAVVGGAPGALELERHRELGDDRRHFAAPVDLLLVRGERLAEPRRIRAQIGIHTFEIPPLGDELGGRLVADAGNARNVVGRVALQRLEVDHLVGPQSVPLTDELFVVDDRVLKTLAGRHQLDARCHELKRIEVS